MKNFDRQQLNLLLVKIKDFIKSKSFLNSIIDDFDAILNNLSKDCESLCKKLRVYWWDLEQVLANVLYRNAEKLNESEIEIISKAVLDTKDEVEKALKNYLTTSDPSVTKTAQEANSNWLICPNCIDAWESSSTDAMVICPKCDSALHNPHYKN